MELLRKVREKVGVSQAEFADKLNVPRSTYSNYERGAREVPIGLLPRLKRASGMTWGQIGKWLEKLYGA